MQKIGIFKRPNTVRIHASLINQNKMNQGTIRK